MCKEINSAFDKIVDSKPDEYVHQVASFLHREDIKSLKELEDAFVDITGDPIGDLEVLDQIDKILAIEQYAQFH